MSAKIHKIINKDNWCQKALFKPEGNAFIDYHTHYYGPLDFKLSDFEATNKICKLAKSCCLAGFCYKVTDTPKAATALMDKIAKTIVKSEFTVQSLSILAEFNDHKDTTWEVVKELCEEINV